MKSSPLLLGAATLAAAALTGTAPLAFAAPATQAKVIDKVGDTKTDSTDKTAITATDLTSVSIDTAGSKTDLVFTVADFGDFLTRGCQSYAVKSRVVNKSGTHAFTAQAYFGGGSACGQINPGFTDLYFDGSPIPCDDLSAKTSAKGRTVISFPDTCLAKKGASLFSGPTTYTLASYGTKDDTSVKDTAKVTKDITTS